MSKRFGRNQRRRMRETIKQQEDKLIHELNRNSRLSRRLSELQHDIDEWDMLIAEAFGNNSIYRHKIESYDGRVRELSAEPVSLSSPQITDFIDKPIFSYVRLRSFAFAAMDIAEGDPRKMLHMHLYEVDGNGERVAYNVSIEALRDRQAPHMKRFLEEKVSKALLEAFENYHLGGQLIHPRGRRS